MSCQNTGIPISPHLVSRLRLHWIKPAFPHKCLIRSAYLGAGKAFRFSLFIKSWGRTFVWNVPGIESWPEDRVPWCIHFQDFLNSDQARCVTIVLKQINGYFEIFQIFPSLPPSYLLLCSDDVIHQVGLLYTPTGLTCTNSTFCLQGALTYVSRRVCKIAKSDYQRRRVCPSVHRQWNLCSHSANFHGIWSFSCFSKTCRNNYNFIKIRQE